MHADPHCPGNVAILRFRLVQRSQIIVPVTINHNGPYDFLVDTGAQVTTVDPALAAELHLKIEGTAGFVGVRDRGPDGAERVFAVLPPQEMQIGTLTFHQISFVTPTAAGKDAPKVEVDGLLPTAIFRRVHISYAGRFVVLEPW